MVTALAWIAGICSCDFDRCLPPNGLSQNSVWSWWLKARAIPSACSTDDVFEMRGSIHE